MRWADEDFRKLNDGSEFRLPPIGRFSELRRHSTVVDAALRQLLIVLTNVSASLRMSGRHDVRKTDGGWCYLLANRK